MAPYLVVSPPLSPNVGLMVLSLRGTAFNPCQRFLRGLYEDCLPTLFMYIRSPSLAFFEASFASDSFRLSEALI
jgi:hypothetical protein